MERLLRQLLAVTTGRKANSSRAEQLALFAAELGLDVPEHEESNDHDEKPPVSASGKSRAQPHG